MKEFNPESPISSLVNDYEKVIKVIESSQNLDQLDYLNKNMNKKKIF
jgi:hypothetical protein